MMTTSDKLIAPTSAHTQANTPIVLKISTDTSGMRTALLQPFSARSPSMDKISRGCAKQILSGTSPSKQLPESERTPHTHITTQHNTTHHIPAQQSTAHAKKKLNITCVQQNKHLSMLNRLATHFHSPDNAMLRMYSRLKRASGKVPEKYCLYEKDINNQS